MESYAVILNPRAGRGKGKKAENEIGKLFAKEIGKYDLFRTEYQGHAEEIAKRIKNQYSVIIAAGGDGTMHEVVNGMLFGSAALGAIPVGSGNDFVKMLNLTRNLPEAIQVIKNNQRKRIDVGKVGEKYFPNGLGIGFDAWVVKESMKIKKLRGFLIYLYAVLKTAFSYHNSVVTFSANGKCEERNIFLIAIGNGKAMGGGFYLTPDAQFDDGLFDVCIIHALSKKEIFLNLPKAIKGMHTQMPQVEMLRTDKLIIQSREGIAAHADGELLGMDIKDFHISLLPAVLDVIYHPIL